MDSNNIYWQKYQRGIDYLNKKSLVTESNRNYNFYAGNQWDGIQAGGESLPFLNIIKPIVKHKVSTVSQNNMVAHFSDAEGREDKKEIYQKMDQLFSADWEHTNMDMNLWTTIKDAAVARDGIQFYGTGDVRDMQILQGTQVLYGDESERYIQRQPYVIIHQRVTVGDAKEIARANGLSEEDIGNIRSDSETQDTVGNRDELDVRSHADEGKVTVVIYMEKRAIADSLSDEKVIHVAKSTKDVVIEPLHPIAVKNADGTWGRGMTLYPIVKYSWEDFPNSARGVSEVSQLVPNQLDINKNLARISLTNKNTAFSKVAYDETIVVNPEALGEVGAPIAVNGGGAQSVNQAVSYLNPAQASPEPRNYVENLMEYTQDLSGSGETAMGNINPNRVAASAIIAIRDQAALPLNEQVAKMKSFVEELAKLWIEIWSVYHPNGLDVSVEAEDDETGEMTRELIHITKEELDELKPSIRIDTSQDNPWTKEAEMNVLDTLLEKQHITVEEWADMLPDHSPAPKNKLKAIFAKRKEEMMEQEGQELEQMHGPEMAEAQAEWEAQDGYAG